jgi:hypothetical protein
MHRTKLLAVLASPMYRWFAVIFLIDRPFCRELLV